MFQNAPIAYVIFNEDLKIIQSNTQFQNYIQCSAEELENINITEFISDISQDEFYLYLNKIRDAKQAPPILINIKSGNEHKQAKLQISVKPIDNSKVFRATFTDMTDVFSLQELLKESKLFYEKIIENSPYCVHGYILDEKDDLIFTFYNQAAVETLNIDHSHLLGKSISVIFPNLRNTEIIEHYKEIAKNGGVVKIENFRYQDNLISGDYSLVAYQPLENQVIILFRNTTQENFQAKIQDIEYAISNGFINLSSTVELIELIKKELNQIIDTSNFCVALFNNENNKFDKIYDCNNSVNKSCFKDDKSLVNIIRSTKTTTHFTYHEIEQLIAENKINQMQKLPKSWLGIPLIDNNIFIGIIVIENYHTAIALNHDTLKFLNTIANYLTTFIQRRKSLHFANILYKSVLNSPVSIIITDRQGKIEFANPKCEEITGYSLDELKGKKTSIFNSGHHDKNFFQNLWNTILSGKTWYGKILNRKKDNSLYWEEAKISPLYDSNNKITNFVAVKEDITFKEKIIEELKIAKEKAEESDRLKSAFLANMSHEIRTPLNAILGFSSILAEEEVDENEKKQFSEIIIEKGEELLRLIEDLLDLSKLEANQIKISNSIVSIPNLFEELRKTYSVILKKHPNKHINIIFNNPEPNDLSIKTDSMRIRQILDNLINNAIKFTEQGTIEVSCELAKDMVHFIVSDTGIGIAKENQEIIFERFRQAAVDFATRKFGGVGLGLPIVKRLVELLGGEIWVESELGKGSKFHFTVQYLPIDK